VYFYRRNAIRNSLDDRLLGAPLPIIDWTGDLRLPNRTYCEIRRPFQVGVSNGNENVLPMLQDVRQANGNPGPEV
jgi:hypothetical protein